MAQVPELCVEFQSEHDGWGGSRPRHTCHDVRCDDSVRRPAVPCYLARVGSDCDHEFERSHTVIRVNRAYSNTQRPKKPHHC